MSIGSRITGLVFEDEAVALDIIYLAQSEGHQMQPSNDLFYDFIL